uniref:Putative senescence-associated protein n=1 Tax=Pisum sativum TaxID=3888 RepID=Q9AVH6_PEA|nr:putative senescence-associated protein [Pisum sativum]
MQNIIGKQAPPKDQCSGVRLNAFQERTFLPSLLTIYSKYINYFGLLVYPGARDSLKGYLITDNRKFNLGALRHFPRQEFGPSQAALPEGRGVKYQAAELVVGESQARRFENFSARGYTGARIYSSLSRPTIIFPALLPRPVFPPGNYYDGSGTRFIRRHSYMFLRRTTEPSNNYYYLRIGLLDCAAPGRLERV